MFFWIWKLWRGREKITKIWISWEQKELFRWNQKHFSWFLKGYHLVTLWFDSMTDTMNLNQFISLHHKSSHKTQNPSCSYTCTVSGKGYKFCFITCHRNFTIFQENTLDPFLQWLSNITPMWHLQERSNKICWDS